MGRFIFLSSGLLVVFLSLSGTGADFQCPSEWSAYGQHCYRAFKYEKSWAEAEKFCMEQANDGHLVSIQSIKEANFVAKLVSGIIAYIWIGLRDRRKEQQCTSEWNDGSKVTYVNWREGESQMCQVLAIWSGFKNWVNTDCASHNPFVCKSPA
uniref:Snaclec 5 n=1 Tax=Bitis arietans TaxID=8692 RepID=SL5_BITAR